MTRYIFQPCYFVAIILLLVCSTTSCVSSKKVIYLRDLTDSASAEKIRIAQTKFESLIQKNDQLSLSFSSSNIADLAVFNSASAGSSGAGAMLANTSGTAFGFLVEADGNIKLPLIGKVKAEGLTRIQLEATLTELLKDYTKNPVVNVRFLNYSFSVLGEVGRAGRFNMPTERTTLLEAISMAGDLTVLAKRENILVIREENGQRTTGRLNLLSKDIFNSPYFYLKTNDLVYVEPVGSKFINRSGVAQYLPIVAVGLSLLITILSLRK